MMQHRVSEVLATRVVIDVRLAQVQNVFEVVTAVKVVQLEIAALAVAMLQSVS